MTTSQIRHPNQINNYEELYEIQVKFDRSNATFKPDVQMPSTQEIVIGSLSLISKNGSNYKIDIDSISMTVSGGVSIQNRQNKPEIEELVKKVPPIRIINLPQMTIAKNKTMYDLLYFSTPETKIPFRFKLEKGQHRYLETYIGVYVSVSYNINALIKFSEKRMIQDEIPFYVQVPKAGRECVDNFIYPKKKNFMVVTDDIKGQKNKIPNFKIRGELDSQICFFNDDLGGSIIVDLADTPIRSIDLQMLRVEKVETEFKVINQKTEIQLIQICDGNVTRNLQIPLYMILPRYYSCPSVRYLWLNLNFEVNLQIIFRDGYKVTVNIPLKLIRS